MLIAQITDTHISETGEQARYLSEAIDWLNALEPAPAAIVLTGDAANSGQRAEYAILRGILARCRAPVYVVPGNHDRRDVLRETLPAAWLGGASGPRLNYAVEMPALRLIGLDSSEEGRAGGVLDRTSLAWFERSLDGNARPAFVFMHHPPFRTGVNAADVLGFRGARELRRIVARHAAVRRIVAGHIHCERRATIGNALATTGVSSTPQAVPEVFERRIFALRDEPPGLTLHAWSADAFTSTTLLNIGAGRFAKRGAG